MKRVALNVFFALIALSACAQKRNVYFLTADGRQVFERDSANYIRLVYEPVAGSNLYPVQEYYAKGSSVRMTGTSSKIFPAMLENECIYYFPNGKKASVLNYTHNKLSGRQEYFYPSGTPYLTLYYTGSTNTAAADENFKILSVADSLGNPLVTEGTGYWRRFNDTFSAYTEEGPVKNGYRNGIWHGVYPALKLKFTETYIDGQLEQGISVDRDSNRVIYSGSRLVLPRYPGGLPEFNKYLNATLRYPRAAAINGYQGTVVVRFVVEANGTVSNITVLQSAGPDLDAEAIRVCKSSTGWLPGTAFGRLSKVPFTVPVVFKIK